jgi:hypothetical protein
LRGPESEFPNNRWVGHLVALKRAWSFQQRRRGMAEKKVDPAGLKGAALERWYRRSPQEIENERRAAEARKHAAFVDSIHQEEREPDEDAFRSPLEVAQGALHDFQNGPKIKRPNLAASFIPVVGPAWEAAADLQEGNYGGAAFNGAMAVADALPIGVAVKGLNAARKGVTVMKKGSVTASAAASRLRDWGVAKKGEEIHHTVPLNGTSRTAQDWRNHYAFLKVLPTEQHRRLTGSWNGKPMYDPIRRVWHGTTDWQKAVPAGVASYAADAWENVTHPFSRPGSSTKPGR